MKAIFVKYIPAASVRGSRLKAWTIDNNQVTIDYPHDANDQDRYGLAALALCNKMGWHGRLVEGVGPNGVHVFTFDTHPRYAGLKVVLIGRHAETWETMVQNNARPGDVANVIIERDNYRNALAELVDSLEADMEESGEDIAHTFDGHDAESCTLCQAKQLLDGNQVMVPDLTRQKVREALLCIRHFVQLYMDTDFWKEADDHISKALVEMGYCTCGEVKDARDTMCKNCQLAAAERATGVQ